MTAAEDSERWTARSRPMARPGQDKAAITLAPCDARGGASGGRET